jgi:hypothetical protein
MMEAWRAATAEWKRTGETLITDQNEAGEWFNRRQTQAELKRSQENLFGLIEADLDSRTPANGGRS